MVTFDEIYFLVAATSEPEALRKAKAFAKKKEVRYRNVYKQPVRWKLAKFLGIQEAPDQRLGDGAEIRYRLFTGSKTRFQAKHKNPQ
jgi:hypothetical protein